MSDTTPNISKCPLCGMKIIGGTENDWKTHVDDEHPDSVDPTGLATLASVLPA